MADISRDTYDRSKGQSKVVFQQKKPLLNYELNLLQDILNEKSIDISRYGLGDNFIGDSFTLYPSTLPNEIFIKKGLFYHKGYPIELTEDVRINGLSTPGANRVDSVFAEWYLDEIDGTDDPSIKDSNLGFETSNQERIILEIKIRENAEDTNTSDPSITTDINPDPVLETITYDGTDKTISLDPLSGNVFPDWLLNNFSSGVTFTTSDPYNPGPFTINSSSVLLNKKTLVVNEALFDTVPHNTVKKLTFYDSNSSKSWVANRRNFFKIANINRTSTATITESMIEDVRDKTVYNYVIDGCSIEKVTTTSVKVNPGRLLVGGIEHFIEDNNEILDFTTKTPVSGIPPVFGKLEDGTINFVFINKAGNLECSQTEPLEFHVLLAEVYTYSGSVYSIIDRRNFIPFAWKNKFSEGNSGETGFPAYSHQYKAAEDIGAYEVVTIVPGTTKDIVKATAFDLSPNPIKVPVIGIAGQAIREGHIDNVVTFGEIKNTAWSFTVNQSVFLDTAYGQLTQTPPSLLGTFTLRVGVAVAPDILFVNPEFSYIKNNPPHPFDTNFLVKRSTGLIEESNDADKISPDKMSFLASVAQSTNDKTFDIFPGRYFVNDTEYVDYSGETVNLGSGTYQTSPLTAFYYNKAYFTLDDVGTVHMYESLEKSASSTVEDPEIPDNELPLSMVVFQDNGSGGAGTIKSIAQEHILDKRTWLNLGNLDNTAFKPVYRDDQTFLIQKGEGWYNNLYVESLNNLSITADTTASGSTYYIYMDLVNASGSVSVGSFTTMLSTPSQLDRRRYIPLGKYSVDGNNKIVRNNFKVYKSKFWKYRDTPYTNEETITLTGDQSSFSLTTLTFLDTDYLDIKINGRQVYEIDDYTKTAPNSINFGYTVKKGAKIKIRKV